MNACPRRVTIVEVGPRDGLQNEAARSRPPTRCAFVDALAGAGHRVIEVSAFVSPQRVPQMADAAEVFAGITRRPGVRYTALVPNLAGLDRALAAGVDEVAVFAAASETFSQQNINQSIDQSIRPTTQGHRQRHDSRPRGARLRLDRLRLSVRGRGGAGRRAGGGACAARGRRRTRWR